MANPSDTEGTTEKPVYELVGQEEDIESGQGKHCSRLFIEKWISSIV